MHLLTSSSQFQGFRLTAPEVTAAASRAHLLPVRSLVNAPFIAAHARSLPSQLRRMSTWNDGAASGGGGSGSGNDLDGAAAAAEAEVDPVDMIDDIDLRKRTKEKSLNSVTLLGRVGGTPLLRGSEEHPVVVFSLATNIRYRKAGSTGSGTGGVDDYETKTDWHNVAVFRPYLRESVLNNVDKGSRLYVTGRILYGHVEDKLGNVRHTTTIVADDVIRFAG